MDWRPYFCALCFGIYPIFMKRSGLNSEASFFAFSVVGAAFAVAFFMQDGIVTFKAATASQIFFIAASACASVTGLLFMFRFLADTPMEKAGTLVIVMIVMQVVFTLVISLMFAKAMPSGNQIVGVAFAIIAIFFLQK